MQYSNGTAPAGIYRITSIARPVDPAYPTNKALLVLLLAAAPLFALAAYAGFVEGAPLTVAFTATLVGFAAWALTRELAPDDNAAAFVALSFAWLMSILTGVTDVLIMFAALFLVRIVNRSTGLAARPWDTLLVLFFVLWSASSLDQPLLALVAALAFATDAMMKDGPRVHWIAAALSIAAGGWWLVGDSAVLGFGGPLHAPAVVLLGCATLIVFLEKPASVCDASGNRLSAGRVKAGLAIGCLSAAQSLLHGQAWTDNLIWACLVAVPVSAIVQQLVRVSRGTAPT